jgi:hypothetical protein
MRPNRDIKMFYKCIYNYTKKNFNLMKYSKPIALLFKNFMNLGAFHDMTKSDKTLLRDPERYINRAMLILKEFEEANDLETSNE